LGSLEIFLGPANVRILRQRDVYSIGQGERLGEESLRASWLGGASVLPRAGGTASRRRVIGFRVIWGSRGRSPHREWTEGYEEREAERINWKPPGTLRLIHTLHRQSTQT